MKCRYLLSTLLLASVVGCVAHVSPNANLKTQIVVDPLTPKDALAPWLMYAGTRSHWMEKKFFEQNHGEATYRYSFAEEVAARDGCARIWLEMKAKDSRVNRYLDDLVTVHQAGFLREYTWTYFRDGSWSEPEGLRLAQFDQWRQVNLRGHELETKAIARFE